MTVKAPEAAKVEKRQPLNLALVIDRSGSMNGPKLEYVQQAALHIVNLLSPLDQLAIITFDDQVEIIHQAAPVDADYKESARRRIMNIRTGNRTNLSDGWLLGCDQIAAHPLERALQRCLLLTDGLANLGITDPEVLSAHSRQLHDRGISTTTFGVGADYNEFLLEQMANNGGGNYYFIQDPEDIPDLFRTELDELTTITAANTTVSVNLPNKVKTVPIGNWKIAQLEDRLDIFLGDIPATQERKAFFKLVCPPMEDQKSINLNAEISARGELGESLTANSSLTLAYGTEEEVMNTSPDFSVVSGAASVIVADAARLALQLERDRNYSEAKRTLQNALLEHEMDLPPSERLEYERLLQRIEVGLSPLMRKFAHDTTYTSSRSMPRRMPRDPKQPKSK